ncbi:hypothetical protein PybrP1_001469 [[Pythium] brassicae (nom. inval.)]|nr:hypothetical protein PybrP1_001469 [[Pythium] brassicae (nom. inval.)]
MTSGTTADYDGSTTTAAAAAGITARDLIVRAAREGDIEQIRVLLLQYQEQQQQQQDAGDRDCAACLNGLGSIGVTPLYMAALKGNAIAVRFLLAHGASPTLATAKQRTPLFASLLGDSLEIVHALVEAGATLEDGVGSELLFEATRRGRFQIARWLVDRGVDVQFACPTNGMTPLFAAASFGNTELAAVFLDRGAPVDARTHKGQTPLFVAALLGYLDMTRFLIERGAHVNALTTESETPLFAAAGWGHLDVVRELVQRGAAVDALNVRGETPLFVAITRGSVAVAAFLITDCGAALDVTTQSGATLLSAAQLHGQSEIAQILQDRSVTAR